jgi:hypothetical protein
MQKIDAKKCLASIIWSVNGIHNLHDVSNRTTLNTAFFTDAGMPYLIDNVGPQSHRKMLKGRLIHMDNVRPHNSERA